MQMQVNTARLAKDKIKAKARILVDYDGVVLRSHTASKFISRQCEEYVCKVTGLSIYEQVRTLNQGLYKTFGHTVLGLRALGYNVSLRDFNKFVYDKIEYANLGIQDYEIDTVGLQMLMREHGDAIHIFSNAPPQWIIGTLASTPNGRKLVDKVNIVKPLDEETLKPEILSYFEVSKIFKDLDNTQLYLVDDAFSNVQGAVLVGGWKGLWYAGDSTSAFRITNDVICVRDMRDVLFQVALDATQNNIRPT